MVDPPILSPIVRSSERNYELNFVLRCNITTGAHPLFPAWLLKNGLAALKDTIPVGTVRTAEVLEKHASWVEEIKTCRTFTEERTLDIPQGQIGRGFAYG